MVDRSDIPVGRDNAISRRALARLWRCDERTVRGIIAEFRRIPSEDKLAILSSSTSPGGYWRSDSCEEIKAFILETEHRARNTFGALKEARRVLKKSGG